MLVLAGCGGDDSSGPAAGSPAPGGALSVQEAIDSDLDGPLLVKGFVVLAGDQMRLCSALAESFPPQCGNPSLRIALLPPTEFPMQEEGDVRWTESEVSLLGDVEGDVLRVSETSK